MPSARCIRRRTSRCKQLHCLHSRCRYRIRRSQPWTDNHIRDFFGSLEHAWLVRFVEHRIGDERVVRLIRQWLAAGVLESGAWTLSETGTPHGGSISPLAANLYMHYTANSKIRHKTRSPSLPRERPPDWPLGHRPKPPGVCCDEARQPPQSRMTNLTTRSRERCSRSLTRSKTFENARVGGCFAPTHPATHTCAGW